MKWVAPFLVAFLPSANAFAAEEVSVVSGEHEGYTRLVFAVSPDRDWNLELGQGSARLIFPDRDLDFADGEVFARIPRTRLISTQSEQRGNTADYLMELGCDCEVTAFPYLDAYIVVDIKDRSNQEMTPPHERHFAPVLNVATLPDTVFQPPIYVSSTSPDAPRYTVGLYDVGFLANRQSVEGYGLTPALSHDKLPSTAHETETTIAGISSVLTREVSLSAEEVEDAIEVARSSLLQQLTLAADQGLLNLKAPLPVIPHISGEIQEIQPNETAAVEEPLRLESDNQVLIQTVFTRDAAAARSEEPEDNSCPTAASLDLASWGSGTGFSAELSDTRSRLLKEFDEPDFAQAERLIRLYLRYGFGVEAKSYLLDKGQNLEEGRLLSDLAAIVDGLPVQSGGPLSQAIGCDGTAGMWAMVGTYPDVGQQIGDKESIVEAYSTLLPDIRRMIGPRLASAFLDRGLDTFARQISDILQRAPGVHGVEHELVIGNLQQSKGRAVEAGKTYQALTEENSRVSTDALIELAALGLKQDIPPPEHILKDLGSAANTLRGTIKGARLRRLEALWTARLVNEGTAIRLLVKEFEKDPENADILRKTAEEVLSALSTNGKLENSYAEVVRAYDRYIPAGEEADKLRLEIAEKLVASGLPDYSISILQPLFQRNNTAAILLFAKAEIFAYHPGLALQILDGIAGDAARLIRAQAYLGLEKFDSALEELKQIVNQANADVMPNWYQGDWTAITASDRAAVEIREMYFPDRFASLRELHNSDELAPDRSKAAPVTLSALRNLLGNSQTLSGELENILNRQ